MQRSVGWLTTVKRWLVGMTDRILVFGASGQLGSAVLATAPSTALEAPRTVDVADSQDVLDCVRKAAPDWVCLLYTSPSPRDDELSRMPSSA